MDWGFSLDLVDHSHDVHDLALGYGVVSLHRAAAQLVALQLYGGADDTGGIGQFIAAVIHALFAAIAGYLQAFFVNLQVAAARADNTNHFFFHAISSTETLRCWSAIFLSKTAGSETFSISPGAM